MENSDEKSGGRAASLANLRPWQPGQSGNPKGRPKGTGLTDILLSKLDDIPQFKDKPNQRTWRELLIDATLQNAIKGNAPILKEIWDRLEGKVKDVVDVNSKVQQDITITDRREITLEQAQAALKAIEDAERLLGIDAPKD